MSAALHDDEATALALDRAREKRERAKIDQAIDDLRTAGVRDGSLGVIRNALERKLPQEEANGGVVNGEMYDAVLDAYMPERHPNGDLVHDRAATLKRQLESGKKVTLDVHCRAYDGRRESISFAATESRAYFEGDLATREALRSTKIRERRLTTAIDAASRLMKESGRRAAIAARTTVDEQLCLAEFGALTTGSKTTETGSGRKRSIETIVRDGWLTRARTALRERKNDLEPRKLLEYWGFDFDQSAEIGRGPTPLIGGTGLDFMGRSYQRLYGPNELQMTMVDTWDEIAKCRHAYEIDPFAKQGVNIAADFVLGRGATFTASDDGGKDDGSEKDGVQAEIDDFIKRHPLQTWKKWLRSAKVMGDLFLHEVMGQDGKLEYVKLPAQTIWEVVTLAEDITQTLFFVQRYQTRFQMFAPVGDEAHYVERIIPAEEVLHFKRNASEDEVRGRSDIYAALPWHFRFRSHWDAQIEKDYATNAYAYKVIVEGSQGAVQRFINTSIPKRRPPPGSWHVFNQKVKEFDVVTSDKTQPAAAGSTNEGILNVISASYGVPKEYFGVSGNRSRGGAVVAEGPVQKMFEDQQDDWGAFMSIAIARQIAQGVAWGRIRSGADTTFRADFPDIIKGDSQARLLLLTVMRAQGALSLETFANLAASAVDLGDTYDYDTERARIAEEAENGITLPTMPPKFDPIDAPGGGQNGGQSGGQKDVPNQTTADGQSQIRHDDQHAEALDDATDDELAAALSERGAIVVLTR